MIPGSKATLDGYPLLASSPITWSLRAGVSPVTQTFDMTPEDAEALVGGLVVGKVPPTAAIPPVAGGMRSVPGGSGSFPATPGVAAKPGIPGHVKAVNLVMEAAGNTVKFEHLYVTGYAPRIVPSISRVTVSDRRWMLRYGHLGPRRYNWRRRGGYKRIVDPGTPKTVQDVRDDVWYAGFSLREDEDMPEAGLRKWRSSEVLQSVFNEVDRVSIGFNPDSKTGWLFASTSVYKSIWFEERINKIPIENLLLDDNLDKAIERVLAYLPSWDVYVSASGAFFVYDKSSGGEYTEWEKMGAPKVGGGLGDMVSNRFRRPKKINVLFTREVELRFDYDELRTLESQHIGEFEKRLEMKNVVSVPDFKLDLPGHGAIKPRSVAQGTWVNLYEALRAWNKSKNTGGPTPTGWPGFGPLEMDFLRRAIVPFIDLWAGVGLAGQTQADADWLGRANSLKTHYRRTFQINSFWWDKILSVNNVRVAILDPETGSRAPSSVYTSFCRISNSRSFYREKFSKVNLNYAINANSYPVGIPGNNDLNKARSYPLRTLMPSDGRMIAADAKVNILDPEQGVIQIEYVPDIYNAYDVILPGQIALPDKNGNVNISGNGVVSNAGPSADISDISNSISFDTVMLNSEHQIPEAIPDYKLAVILSVIPATWDVRWHEEPDSVGGEYETGVGSLLERVVIESDDLRLKDMVSEHVQSGLGDALGPALDVRVGAGVEVARVAWSDDYSHAIKGIFGVEGGFAHPQGPDLGSLVINRGDEWGGDARGGASLNEIALSVAARVYSGMVDHLQGSESGDFPTQSSPDTNEAPHPEGWLDEVTYELSTAGEGSVIVDFPEEIEKFDLLSYMDESTRAIIMKLAAKETS